jgi:cobalt-zinc-cadmium resistance protein CzcA
VKFSVRGRDLAGTIDDAKAAILRRVQLPYGVHLDWGGEMNELEQVEGRMAIVVPITLVLIGLLIYAAVRSWLETVLVLLDIPAAVAGGLVALLVTGTHLSVSAMLGFVSIFGIAVQDSLLIATYFERLRAEQTMTIAAAAREASQKRLRAVLMTTVVATLGLLPAALSNGIGAQTQKPLAIVVIGGALSVALLVRVVQPSTRALAYAWVERR